MKLRNGHKLRTMEAGDDFIGQTVPKGKEGPPTNMTEFIDLNDADPK
jgi:hypothetical protein